MGTSEGARAVPDQGSRLVMPLLRLAGEHPAAAPAPVPVRRTLHLDAVSEGLVAWAARVREAEEACLLLDDQGRVAAMSREGGALLGLHPSASVGALLLDLVLAVDFTAAAVPLPDPAPKVPPLRALASGSLARGLVRVRRGELLATYDVVGVPVQGGALAFLTEV